MSESDADFEARKQRDIDDMRADDDFRTLSRKWFAQSIRHRYSYNFRWLGLPIIQYPADIIAVQELIWRIKPHAIVETGIARGGSIMFYASMLELLGGNGIAVGVEIALSAENREAIEAHRFGRRVKIVDGSSISAESVERVKAIVGKRGPVLVVLDSHHTHDHVLAELRAYAPLVGRDSYIVVFDTVVDDLAPEDVGARPWHPGNSPKSALHEFLGETDRFQIDRSFDDRLLLSVCPEGFLRCVRD
jgi:cephalosporin hydroxylase